MTSDEVQVLLPRALAELLSKSADDLDARVLQALVLQLFQEDAISSGKAAEMLNMSMDEMRALLAERGIPYFRQSIEEVLSDARVASAAKSKH